MARSNKNYFQWKFLFSLFMLWYEQVPNLMSPVIRLGNEAHYVSNNNNVPV